MRFRQLRVFHLGDDDTRRQVAVYRDVDVLRGHHPEANLVARDAAGRVVAGLYVWDDDPVTFLTGRLRIEGGIAGEEFAEYHNYGTWLLS